MKIRTRTIGLRRLRDRLRRYPRHTTRAVERALYQEAEETITDAKEDTPVDTGALRASGFVDLPERRPKGVFVKLGFGGVAGSGNQGQSNAEDVGYAVFVHEDCNAFHAVGRCKYLEIHVRQAVKRLPRRIAREVHQETRRRTAR